MAQAGDGAPGVGPILAFAFGNANLTNEQFADGVQCSELRMGQADVVDRCFRDAKIKIRADDRRPRAIDVNRPVIRVLEKWLVDDDALIDADLSEERGNNLDCVEIAVHRQFEPAAGRRGIGHGKLTTSLRPQATSIADVDPRRQATTSIAV
jgi:hypothetical protein